MILVCIAGGPSLTMTEVNRIMEQINRHCEHAHIIMGAAIDEELDSRLTVTLVASRKGNAECGARNAESTNPSGAPELASQLVDPSISTRTASRFIAPPPETTAETTEQLLRQQSKGGGREKKNASRLRQGQLPLEIVSRGRFEKSEPTIHHGADLDVPTYVRRNVPLN